MVVVVIVLVVVAAIVVVYGLWIMDISREGCKNNNKVRMIMYK